MKIIHPVSEEIDLLIKNKFNFPENDAFKKNKDYITYIRFKFKIVKLPDEYFLEYVSYFKSIKIQYCTIIFIDYLYSIIKIRKNSNNFVN